MKFPLTAVSTTYWICILYLNTIFQANCDNTTSAIHESVTPPTDNHLTLPPTIVHISPNPIVAITAESPANVSTPVILQPVTPPTDAPVTTKSETKTGKIQYIEYYGGNQSEVLTSLYNTLDGDKWKNKHNWLANSDVCSWEGITCEDNTISRLELPSNNMEGALNIPAFLRSLPGLKDLNIENNNLQIVDIEGPNYSLTSKLEKLNVNRIDFEKVFERFFQNVKFPELRELSMVSCHIDSEFPFFDKMLLPKIEKLDLDDNDFDNIPLEFVTIETLKFLSLNDNFIDCEIPNKLGNNLPNLEFVYLGGNYFKGNIPGSLTNLQNLEVVDISDQLENDDCGKGYGLTGPLPSFSNSPNLRRLDLGSNCLTGTIPEDFLEGTDPETFEYIGLDHNKLTGKIPRITAFIYLDDDDISLYDNQFTIIDKKNCEDRDYECDSLVCPIGTYNEDGYQDDDDEPCLSCPTNKFLGSTKCYPMEVLPGEKLPTISLSPTPVPPKQMSEEEILKVFYDSLGGSEWTNNDNWESSDNHCTWFGVECNDEGSVESLIIMGNNMKGKLATEIYLLPNLNTLTISDSVMVDIIFTGIEYANSLRSLDVSGTGLSDVEDLDNAPELTELNLANNTIAGGIPWQVFELDTLEALRLNHNKLSGEIDGDDIMELKDLKIFIADENQITGTIPESLADCQLLHTLTMSGNKLTGQLPNFFNDMTDLMRLDLSHNSLEGHLIPFDNHKDLRKLILIDNALSGTIPPTFLAKVDKESFKFAALSNNYISGTIPASLAGLQVELQNNKIEAIDPANYDPEVGGIAADFGSDGILCPPGKWNALGKQAVYWPCEDCPSAQYYGITKCSNDNEEATTHIQKQEPIIDLGPVLNDEQILTKLYETCGGNEWYRRAGWTKSVSICEWEGIKCLEEHVQAIYLASNNINCKPPSDILTLPYLEKLSLYNNPLGSFDFSQIALAKNLTTLLLDATGLTSIAGIEKAPKLQKLNLRYNSLEGELPIELKQLKSLKFLSLSNNKFEGKFPDIFENMPNLETLLIQSNKFSGELSTFKLPNSVTIFDMSDNEFSGPIESSFLSNYPTDWATTEHIEADLSDNMLTGTVPATFARFESINLYLKGNYIDGISPELCVKTQWNDGDVGAFGCDGLLCPYKTWASSGRSTKTHICGECSSAHYFGSDTCSEPIGSESKSNASSSLLHMSTTIHFIIIITIIGCLGIGFLRGWHIFIRNKIFNYNYGICIVCL